MGILYGYHSSNRPAVEFYGGKDNGENLFLGVELEVDTRNTRIGSRENKLNCIDRSNQIFGNDTFTYYMYDGSLCYGMEMITQPATLEYHKSIADKYTSIFTHLTEKGFKSQSYKSCGYHIHFNRSYFGNQEDYCTAKLLYMVEKFWTELVLFSRRNYDVIDRWAGKYKTRPSAVVKERKTHRLTRYRAVNLCNNNTIEFRLFKGTLEPEVFFYTLQLVHNMIVCAKHKTVMEIQSMKFEELLTTKEMVKYNKKCNRKTSLDKLPTDLRNKYVKI